MSDDEESEHQSTGNVIEQQNFNPAGSSTAAEKWLAQTGRLVEYAMSSGVRGLFQSGIAFQLG